MIAAVHNPFARFDEPMPPVYPPKVVPVVPPTVPDISFKETIRTKVSRHGLAQRRRDMAKEIVDIEEGYGLTPRKQQFIDALLGAAYYNPVAAAAMAGYKKTSKQRLADVARRMLNDPDVQAVIAQRRAAKMVSPEWVRNSLIEIASANMANFITVEDGDEEHGGDVCIDFEKAAAAGALGQIREYREETFTTKGGHTIVKRTIKLFDRRAALETLAKMDGKLIDRYETTTVWDVRNLSSQDLDKLIEIQLRATGNAPQLEAPTSGESAPGPHAGNPG